MNYFNELDNFITRKGNYNPVFQYKRPSLEKLLETKDELKKIQERTDKLESSMKHLFLEKADELIRLMQERRTALISAAVTGKIDVRDWVAPDTQDVEASQETTA